MLELKEIYDKPQSTVVEIEIETSLLNGSASLIDDFVPSSGSVTIGGRPL